MSRTHKSQNRGVPIDIHTPSVSETAVHSSSEHTKFSILESIFSILLGNAVDRISETDKNFLETEAFADNTKRDCALLFLDAIQPITMREKVAQNAEKTKLLKKKEDLLRELEKVEQLLANNPQKQNDIRDLLQSPTRSKLERFTQADQKLILNLFDTVPANLVVGSTPVQAQQQPQQEYVPFFHEKYQIRPLPDPKKTRETWEQLSQKQKDTAMSVLKRIAESHGPYVLQGNHAFKLLQAYTVTNHDKPFFGIHVILTLTGKLVKANTKDNSLRTAYVVCNSRSMMTYFMGLVEDDDDVIGVPKINENAPLLDLIERCVAPNPSGEHFEDN